MLLGTLRMALFEEKLLLVLTVFPKRLVFSLVAFMSFSVPSERSKQSFTWEDKMRLDHFKTIYFKNRRIGCGFCPYVLFR